MTFQETMSGPFSFGHSDPTAGASLGKRTGWELSLYGTVTIADIDSFRADPEHRGELSGELSLPGRRHRAPFRGGLFSLFAPTDQPDLSLMIYEAPLTLEGVEHFFSGRKTVRDDPGLDLWPDTTTLEVTLHRGIDGAGPIVGSGILRIGVRGLASMVLSARTAQSNGSVDSARTLAMFGRLFLLNLVDSYLLRPRTRRLRLMLDRKR